MSDAKFTPGPWSAKQRQIISINPKNRQETRVANVDEFFFTYKEEEAANAALIAAAPDLYAALQGAEVMLREAAAKLRECGNKEYASACELWEMEAGEALAKARNENKPT